MKHFKILIGADKPEAFFQLTFFISDSKIKPIAVDTQFHWTLFGSKRLHTSNIRDISVIFFSISNEEDINRVHRSFWKMETEIIHSTDDEGLPQDEKYCLQ